MARAKFETSAEGIDRLTRAMDHLTSVFERYGGPLARLGIAAAGAEATERAVWGLEARYYVRGGMDPALSAPEALNGAVRAILDGSESFFIGALPPSGRASVAAALIRGWVNHHEIERPEVLAWFRLHGTDAVEVTTEKEQN